MSKIAVTVFLCSGKDCTRAWHRLGAGSPGKWLKHQVEEAKLPYKLKIIKTECMDRCDQAACLCFMRSPQACFETEVRSTHDRDRLLAGLRSCVEKADVVLHTGLDGGSTVLPLRRG
jgi:hypothetical protein